MPLPTSMNDCMWPMCVENVSNEHNVVFNVYVRIYVYFHSCYGNENAFYITLASGKTINVNLGVFSLLSGFLLPRSIRKNKNEKE